jgi:hypothetical protein
VCVSHFIIHNPTPGGDAKAPPWRLLRGALIYSQSPPQQPSNPFEVSRPPKSLLPPPPLPPPPLRLWSKVFLDYVGLREALRAVIRMHAGQVEAWQRSPSLPLQCRQCRSRGRDLAPDMQVGVWVFSDESPDYFALDPLWTGLRSIVSLEYVSILSEGP